MQKTENLSGRKKENK